MKLANLFLFAVATAVLACKPGVSDHQHDNQGADSVDNIQALYDQVMDIHDEVMPKSSDLYILKKKLQDEIAAAPDMVIESRKDLERRISNLDSVDLLMKIWMREFEPLPDTAANEARRAYLELEMERIRRVKTAILEIIEQETTDK